MARILVVDDAAITRTMLRDILEKAGHTVAEAADGDAAVAAFRESPADMAFVDIFMPGKEGLATIKELLEMRPGLPIVAMSAGSTFTDTETLGWARSYGAKCALAKPLQAKTVLEAVAQALVG
ncbi:response regulator receiver protein [Solidesulfovibrio fructosivorans JJ]]|uniref:Response regulator receiver protein n=1 Tax=Solidesulfovibrio fructosivorans JJ] TaxID=596151 RepID=E1JS31_SOLFR|nr:response regulator [Solidesulfovibrio fructosivorans]EFL52800.1 response regulator receiver protein [Solidesulfovibrio fructosivorans JJ]]